MKSTSKGGCITLLIRVYAGIFVEIGNWKLEIPGDRVKARVSCIMHNETLHPNPNPQLVYLLVRTRTSNAHLLTTHNTQHTPMIKMQ